MQSGVVPSDPRIPLAGHLERIGGGVALSLFSAVPKGSGLAKAAASLGLQLLEAATVAEALVKALGVNPADDRA